MNKLLTKKLERLQKAVFLYSALAIAVYSAVGIVASVGASDTHSSLADAGLFVLTAAILAAYRLRKATAKHAFSALLLVMQLKTSSSVILLASEPDAMTAALVFREMLLMGFPVILALFAYTPALSYALAGIATAVYAAAALLSGETVLEDSFLLIFALFGSCALMEHYIVQGIRSLIHDNRRFLAERRSLFSLFNIDDSQVSQFIRLLRKRDLNAGQTEQLLKLLGDETERRIRQSVLHMMRHRQTDYSKLDERLPSLTATERKVASLILQGKTHPEIARELLKSPSNVSVIRSNIRKKMGLGPKDNLAESLHARMQEPEGTAQADAAAPADPNALPEQRIPITE